MTHARLPKMPHRYAFASPRTATEGTHVCPRCEVEFFEALGFVIVLDPDVPPGEIHFRDRRGTPLGQIRIPKSEEEKQG